jgi:hypothetical protein
MSGRRQDQATGIDVDTNSAPFPEQRRYVAAELLLYMHQPAALRWLRSLGRKWT